MSERESKGEEQLPDYQSDRVLREPQSEFIEHFHAERNHQGKSNVLLFPAGKVGQQKPRTRVRCRERLGGLMKYYSYVT